MSIGSRGGFWRRHKISVLSFAVPFAIMLCGFAFSGVRPFGSLDPMLWDWRSQYYPLLVEFRRFVRSGEFPLWRWNGGGVNYVAVFAYYLASPWNLVACLLPEDWLIPFSTVSVCARIAGAGAAMSWFLRKVHGREDMSAVFAGCGFSFCSFLMGYYWNVIWLDTVALTPLVVLGTVYLLRDGKFRFYGTVLFLSVATNFYIGFFTCMFVFVTFVGWHVLGWDGFRPFLRRLRVTAAVSAVSVGCAAVLLLPAYLALKGTYAATGAGGGLGGMNFLGGTGISGFVANMAFVLPSLADVASPTVITGTSPPNAGGGVVGLVLYVLFLLDGRIRLRERMFSLGLVLSMFAGCVVRVLDYVLHGFHFTNMIPHRFMYLAGFVVVACGYREFLMLDGIGKRAVERAGIVLFLLLACGTRGYGPMTLAVGGALAVGTVAAMETYAEGKMPEAGFLRAMACAVVVQSCIAAACGVRAVTAVGAVRDPYPPEAAGVADAVAYAESAGGTGDWHIQFQRQQIQNDSALYGSRGTGAFLSVVDSSVPEFYEAFGLMGFPAGNRFGYAESSPVADAVMGVRYLVSVDGTYYDADRWSPVYRSGDVVLLENGEWLPGGFMACTDALGWDTDPATRDPDPFARQEDLFLRMSGVDGPLYRGVEPESFERDWEGGSVAMAGAGRYVFTEAPDRSVMKWHYGIREAGWYYIYLMPVTGGRCGIMADGTESAYDDFTGGNLSAGGIRSVGWLDEGAGITVGMETKAGEPSGEVQVLLKRIDMDVFGRGYDVLSRNVMEGIARTGTGMSGTVDAPEPGLLFTTVPYGAGWTAAVDGERADAETVGGCMAALVLDAGRHEVSFSYVPPGLVPGMAVSAACLAVAAVFCRADRKKGRGDAPEGQAIGFGRDSGLQRGGEHRMDGADGVGRDGEAGL